MNKQALFSFATLVTGVGLCAGIVALQGGALVGGTVTLAPAASASAAPAPAPVEVELAEITVVGDPPTEASSVPVRPSRKETGAARDPVKAKQHCYRQGNVVICDSQPRTEIHSNEYKRSGGIVGDYRQDFLEALED